MGSTVLCFIPNGGKIMNEQIKKRLRGRSPSYPGINLESAIERAKTIWKEEGQNLVPTGAAFDHWGYKPKSSGGLTALAALKKFGLIDDEGSGENRKIKLSQLALTILWDERTDSPDRKKAIQEAALNPPIHRELWDRYNSQIPSEATLKIELRHKGFTENAIDEFIREFKDTLSFAKLDKNDIISGRNQDQEENKVEPSSSIKTREHKSHIDLSETISGISGHFQHSRTIEIPIPLSPTESAKIQTTYPLSEKSWNQMINILNAYKPSLVFSKDKDEDEEKENQH